MAETVTLTEGVENTTDTVTEEIKDGAALLTEGGEVSDAGKTEDGTTDSKESPGAPEKYEDFKLPEGFAVDETRMEGFVNLAKENKLSQEAAQKFIDLYTELTKADVDAGDKAWQEVLTGWKQSSETDKEFGGQNYKANVAVAKKVFEVEGLTTPEFKDMLNTTMVGSHPEMIRFMYRLGKMFSDDKIFVGGNPKGEQRSAAQVLFGETSPA